MEKSRSVNVFEENLSWLENDQAEHIAVMRGVLSELISSEFTGAAVSPRRAAKVFSETVGALSDPEHMRMFAVYCAELTRRAADSAQDRSADKLQQSNNMSSDLPLPEASVAYVRSAAADAVFDTVSRGRSGLRALYALSFADACEDVYYERADYCILPLEDSLEGLLMPFRRMIMKYDLRLCDAVRYRNEDDVWSVLALVGGANSALYGNIFELYLPAATSADILCISTLFETLGAELIRMTSVMSEYGYDYDCHICVRAEGDVAQYLEYAMAAAYPSCQILGRYSIHC